ncbi:MgtC/SapB family protein [Oceanobacillus sp. CAU 1775]
MDENFTTILIRLFVILILSGIIGFEREWNHHSAGFRTHILVGLGACLMMLMSLYGFTDFIDAHDNVRFDPARIPSYVISGIGFLGAGTIIVYGGTIRGLTTAASIWAVAGIGLVVGVGMYGPAVVTTILILVSLVLLNGFEKKFVSKKKSMQIEIVIEKELRITEIIEILEKHEITIVNVEVEKLERDLRAVYIKMNTIENIKLLGLFEAISKLEYVNHATRFVK